jgi:His-Xaa-Ser system protein HxsD
VKKAAYRVADRCTAQLGELKPESVDITFRFAPGASDAAKQEGVRLFFQELLDQELREQVAEETSPLRALILAHAFSRIDVIRRD